MGMLFAILLMCMIVICFYCLLVGAISRAVASNYVGGHKPFWWIFFLGIFGIIIVILLDIRDCKFIFETKEDKPKTKTKKK